MFLAYTAWNGPRRYGVWLHGEPLLLGLRPSLCNDDQVYSWDTVRARGLERRPDSGVGYGLERRPANPQAGYELEHRPVLRIGLTLASGDEILHPRDTVPSNHRINWQLDSVEDC